MAHRQAGLCDLIYKILLQIFIIIPPVIIIWWLSTYLTGFSFSASYYKQNFHCVSMTVGMFSLFTEGVVTFRIFNLPYRTARIVHGWIMVAVSVFIIIGMSFIVSDKFEEGYANLWSTHSWMGVLTVIPFLAQTTLGFITFMFPKLSPSFQKVYKPLHIYFGWFMYATALGTIIIGILEVAVWYMVHWSDDGGSTCSDTYKEYYIWGLMVNGAGYSIFLAVLLVVFFQTWPRSGAPKS